MIFLPCFSTELARYCHTGNKQKISHRTVYFSTSVRPVMFHLWYDHCTSPPLSRKLHPFFLKYCGYQKYEHHFEQQKTKKIKHYMLLWSTEFVLKLEKQKNWSQLPHSKGKYPLLSGRRRSRHRSQIVVNDTLGDSGDSALFKYVSVLQRVAFLIILLFIWTTSSRHFPNNKIFNWNFL